MPRSYTAEKLPIFARARMTGVPWLVCPGCYLFVIVAANPILIVFL
jgi:hypothetical protein